MKLSKFYKSKFIIMIIGIPVLLALGFFILIPQKKELSYQTYLKNVHTESYITNEVFNVEFKGLKENKFKFKLTNSLGYEFYVETDNDYQGKEINGISYVFEISYDGIKEKYQDVLFQTPIGNSYTEEEYTKYNNLDYSKELKKFYDKYFYE